MKNQALKSKDSILLCVSKMTDHGKTYSVIVLLQIDMFHQKFAVSYFHYQGLQFFESEIDY